jgi:hypothetical protein
MEFAREIVWLTCGHNDHSVIMVEQPLAVMEKSSRKDAPIPIGG